MLVNLQSVTGSDLKKIYSFNGGQISELTLQQMSMVKRREKVKQTCCIQGEDYRMGL